jgi:hypothetical protein
MAVTCSSSSGDNLHYRTPSMGLCPTLTIIPRAHRSVIQRVQHRARNLLLVVSRSVRKVAGINEHADPAVIEFDPIEADVLTLAHALALLLLAPASATPLGQIGR